MVDMPEEIQDFFDARVNTYDKHMAESVEDYETFYNMIASPFPQTNKQIEVLDIGAGTGIEIAYILDRVPNAKITAVDLSEVMLNKLFEKYENHRFQIRMITDNYLTMKLEPNRYDFIVSIMSLHHLESAQKISLYIKLRKALAPGGTFIEGDYIVSESEEARLLKGYQHLRDEPAFVEGKLYHFDIPFSEKNQINALIKAGFKDVNVIYRTPRSNIIYAKTKTHNQANSAEAKKRRG